MPSDRCRRVIRPTRLRCAASLLACVVQSWPSAVTVGSAWAAAPAAIYAGYYDTHHPGNPQPKPNPWQGSPNVTFDGVADSAGQGWDTSTIRVDNIGGSTFSSVSLTVDIGTHHYALWGAHALAPGAQLIFAQTGFENFDGSDTNPAGCFTCDPNDCLTRISSTIPVVHVTIDGSTSDYQDTQQILNTHGVDAAGCPYTGTRNDESEAWQLLGSGVDVPRLVSEPALLSQPWPNPARSSVRLRFSVPEPGAVRVGIYDPAGRLVRACVDDVLEPGHYVLRAELAGFAPGVYVVRLATPLHSASHLLVLAR